MKGRKIFGEGFFLAEEKKGRERKGRKYLEKVKIFLRRRRKWKREGGEYHGEGKIVAGRVEGPIRIISGMIRL